VLGLGERAGNAALEQVAAALDRLRQGRTRIDLARLAGLAELVARSARRFIPPAQPIVGEVAFTHESGIHVSGLLRDPATYEAMDPALFGRERRIVLGKHSGAAAVREALQRAGLTPCDKVVADLVQLLRVHAGRVKRPVTPPELLALHAEAATC
jgi:homocitrate synthase NifV